MILIGLFGSAVKAQQLPLYSQYTMNRFLLNPAVAGTSGFTTISLTAREQWVGFKGTPKTHSITIDSKLFPDSYILKNIPIRKNEKKSTRAGKIGVGAHIYNDHNGPIDRTGIEGAYAYHVELDKILVSMGVSINFFQMHLSKEKLIMSDEDYDDLIDGGKKSLYIPDANIGIFAISKNYYAGLSMMNAFQSSVQFGNSSLDNYRLKRQYNLMGGYEYQLNENLYLQPSLLFKVPEGSKAQLDVQMRVNIRKEFWAGMTFRTGSAMCVFGGAKIDRYYIGYAYDYNFNSLMNHTYGSHEIMAAVKLGDTARRLKWLNEY